MSSFSPSQVFLNGLSADEDTLVRVRHRREKSNSIGSIGSGVRRLRARSTASSSTTDGDELSGLPETNVDSEEVSKCEKKKKISL